MILNNLVILNLNPNHRIFFEREYKKNIKEKFILRLKSYKTNQTI